VKHQEEPFVPEVDQEAAAACAGAVAAAAYAGSSCEEESETCGLHTSPPCQGVPAACSYSEREAHQSR